MLNNAPILIIFFDYDVELNVDNVCSKNEKKNIDKKYLFSGWQKGPIRDPNGTQKGPILPHPNPWHTRPSSNKIAKCSVSDALKNQPDAINHGGSNATTPSLVAQFVNIEKFA